MTLNRDDFPGLTDEQWNAITAEADRRATEASRTARENARKGYISETDLQARLDAAMEEERKRLEASEAERIEMERTKIEQERAALARDRRALKVQKDLAEAKIPDDKIATLTTLFANVDDAALDGTVKDFISLYQDSVKAAVDTQKQTLLGNAEPPAGPTGGPTDLTSQVNSLLEAGNDVAAIHALLSAAAGTPAT